jgi:CheY-like chemotaxis protein
MEDDVLILLADHAKKDRQELAEVLTLAGFRVEVAGDGAEAIKKATLLKPTLLLMDMSLPNIDAIEVIRALKGETSTKHIAMVILTPALTRTQAARALKAGCDGFMSKPYAASTLVAKVSWFVRKVVKV